MNSNAMRAYCPDGHEARYALNPDGILPCCDGGPDGNCEWMGGFDLHLEPGTRLLLAPDAPGWHLGDLYVTEES